MSENKAPRIFISYNRADRDWAEWIAGALSTSGYEPRLQAWHFRPGENFVLRMLEETAAADVTIAIITEAYLKAAFTHPEWTSAFAKDPTGKKKKLIPVRVGECEVPPILGEIISIDIVGLDESGARRELLGGLKTTGAPDKPPPFPGRANATFPNTAGVPFPPSLAQLYGVQDLPPHFLERSAELSELKDKLFGATAMERRVVGLWGTGGAGKTVLSTSAVRDSDVRKAFCDGIYWVTLGQKPNVLNLQGRLARQIGAVNLAFTSELEAKDSLRHAFADKRALVVLDDLWEVDSADFFLVASPPSLVLVTTRNRDVLVGLGADEQLMAALSPTDALQMLATWAGEIHPETVPQVGSLIAKECGYLPLALAMIGGMIRLGDQSTAWNDALSRLQLVNLEAIKRTFPGYPYPNLARAIDVSIEALDTADHERYLNLAVFPEDQLIPETPLRVLWELDELGTRDCMARFVGRSLVTQATTLDGELRIRTHDLLGDLIRNRRERELPALHRRLVSAWTDLKRLPDLYAWHRIAYHLVHAERSEDLRSLLLDFDWLQAKVYATDVLALIDDYDRLKKEEVISLIQSAIRLSAHAVISDPTQLAGQLVGRFRGESLPAIRKILRQASDWNGAPWLRPVVGNLHPPGNALMRILSGHTDKISAAGISPDGRRVISGSHDGTVKIWDLEHGRELFTFQGHKNAISALAISANGRFASTGSHDGVIKVWDLETGKEFHTFKQGSDVVSSIVINRSGRSIISGSSDGFVRIWSLQTAELMRAVRAHRSAVTGVALSRDERLAVSASDDATLKVWDTTAWRELRTLRGHAARVTSVAISPEGLRLASGSEDRTIKIWQMSSGRTMRTMTGHNGPIASVAFSPNGTQIVSSSYDKTLAVWDLGTSTRRKLEGHTHFVTAAAISPKGGVLVSGSWDRTLMVWDLENKRRHRPPLGHWDAVTSVVVSQDSRFALSTSYDQNLTLWNLQTGKEAHNWIWPDMTMTCLGISSDGLWAISGSTNGITKVWEVQSGKELFRLGQQLSITAVVLYSDKSRAISGATDGTLKLWDLAKEQELATLQGHTAAVSALCMGSSTRWLISSSDRTLKVWDLIKQREAWTLRGHDHLVTAIGVSKDLELAVSASRDGTVRTWNPLLGAGHLIMRGHTGGVNAVAISPDGTLVVSGGDDHTLRVWLTETGECLSTFTGEGAITCCSIAPDNRSIAAGEVSGRIHFLRLEATAEIGAHR